MKRERLTVKQRITKKIELRHKQLVFLNKKGEKKTEVRNERPVRTYVINKIEEKPQEIKRVEAIQLFLNFLDNNENEIMNEGDRLRIYGIKNKPGASTIDVKSLTNDERTKLRTSDGLVEPKKNHVYEIKDYGKYVKPISVDYDVIIYVSSYNRYKKLRNILKQLHKQKTNYSFKIIVMNDGSTELEYNTLTTEFPNIIYMKNQINGGLELYWETVDKIFREVKKYRTYAVIQIDDDFILCDEFINRSMNKFFEIKNESNAYMGLRYHLQSFKENQEFSEDRFDRIKRFQDFDGGSMFDPQFLQLFNYRLVPDQNNSHLWFLINQLVRKLGVLVYTMRESLAYHDGNDDSKLNPELRKKRKLYSVNFVGNVSEHDTK
jgi:hypothetical protein